MSGYRPLRPELVRKGMQHYAGQPVDALPAQEKRGALLGHLSAACKQLDPDGNDLTEENRHLLLGWLFTPDDEIMKPLSSLALTPAQWVGLDRWIDSHVAGKKENGKDRWEAHPEFKLEVTWLVTRARWDYTQVQAAQAQGLAVDMESCLRHLQSKATYRGELEQGGMVAAAIGDHGGLLIYDAPEELFNPPEIYIDQPSADELAAMEAADAEIAEQVAEQEYQANREAFAPAKPKMEYFEL